MLDVCRLNFAGSALWKVEGEPVEAQGGLQKRIPAMNEKAASAQYHTDRRVRMDLHVGGHEFELDNVH